MNRGACLLQVTGNPTPNGFNHIGNYQLTYQEVWTLSSAKVAQGSHQGLKSLSFLSACLSALAGSLLQELPTSWLPHLNPGSLKGLTLPCFRSPDVSLDRYLPRISSSASRWLGQWSHMRLLDQSGSVIDNGTPVGTCPARNRGNTVDGLATNSVCPALNHGRNLFSNGKHSQKLILVLNHPCFYSDYVSDPFGCK